MLAWGQEGGRCRGGRAPPPGCLFFEESISSVLLSSFLVGGVGEERLNPPGWFHPPGRHGSLGPCVAQGV